MKKSFIALAVLAAASVASAQSTVTLSGNYTFGYKNLKVGDAKTAGFGTDTAAVKFAATEDLGGGLKAAAQVTAAKLNRGGAVEGEDAKIDLMGSFGTITLGSIEMGNSLFRSQAGGPTFNFDSGFNAYEVDAITGIKTLVGGGVMEGGLNADVVKYTSPNYGGFSFNAGYHDHAALSKNGLGEGTTGGGFAQPGLTFGADYANGPIDAGIDFTAYQKKNNVDYVGNQSNRVRVSGSYDLGSVKLGAGFGRYNYTNNEKSKSEAAFGVSAPVGPVTLGAYFATAKKADAKASGVSFGAKYDLSKRTNVVGKFGSWKNSDKDTAGATTTVKSNRFDMLVSHSF